MKSKCLASLIVGFAIIFFVGQSLADTTVRIGALLPLTGPLAKAGQTVKKVYEFAVEEVNAQGGIRSMGGAKLELVFGDNQSKPDIAISEVERLVEKENVAIITEAWQSAVTLPATPKLLILDEPSLGLAPLMVKEVFKVVGSLHARDGITTLLVEQNIKHALSLSHYAYVLENGSIVLEGPSDEIMNNEHTKKAYLGI